MSIINNGLLLASGADAATTYQISRSLRFNRPDATHLSRTPSSAGNRRTFTFSAWVKRSNTSAEGEVLFVSSSAYICFTGIHSTATSADRIGFFDYNQGFNVETAGVFRDFSSWFHLVVAVDTPQATASNRVKIYINGQLASLSTTSYPTQSAQYPINDTSSHRIGRTFDSQTTDWDVFNGYLADIYFLDGTATTPSTFAQTDAVTGQWVPKTPTGISYGTNGFRLTFSDNSGTTSTTLGKDAAGSNNWSPNNFSVASGSGNDSLVDSPSSYGTDTGAGGEVRGNYATLNPLNSRNQTTLANGNLDAGPNSTNNGTAHAAFSTIGVDSGKWYCEATVISGGSSSNIMVGISDITQLAGNVFDFYSRGYGYRNDALKINNNSVSSYGATYTNNDVIGIALDLTAGTLVFYKNGSSQGTAFSGISSSYVYHFACFVRNTDDKVAWNFGQRAFAYTAPSGFKALCDTNLTAPTIALPNTVMDVALWSGNSGSQSITLPGSFNPDFVWVKSRSNGSFNHIAVDAVRGSSAILHPNLTLAEFSNSNYITAFNSNGFTLGSSTDINGSGNTFVAWCWDAGTSTVTNNNGTISSQVRANASAGFSVVSAPISSSGGSIGHGLNVSPGLIIVKNRGTNGTNWVVWHSSLGTNDYLLLNSTSAKATSANLFNGVSSTTFTVGSGFAASTLDFICYCFAPVAGYSSFGSYTGNGSTDGPFVFCGFRPRWILIKSSSNAEDWKLYDTARDSYNLATAKLYPNISAAENGSSGETSSTNTIDVLSNGFKMRTSNSGTNASAATYVWAAFAESPFAYSRAR